ncbi:MAG: hypothetical protein H7Z70_08395 [Bacteroidia bacterium]|nr:hypothetical protein [Methylotenera sp.]
MSLMSREDMLRELELLPVWSLRSPQVDTAAISIAALPEVTALKKIIPIESNETIESISSIESLQVVIEQSITVELATQSPKLLACKHIASEDGNYLFVLPNTEMPAEESLLLRNILIAMRVKTKAIELPANTLDVLSLIQPKLIITMGEKVAQYLLQSDESLAGLRGILHHWQSVALVATYDLQHLLQILPDKAKAWDDLCFAMQTLQRLKSVA